MQALPGSGARRGPVQAHLVGDIGYVQRTMHALLRGVKRTVLKAAYRDVELAEIPTLTGLTTVSAEAAR